MRYLLLFAVFGCRQTEPDQKDPTTNDIGQTQDTAPAAAEPSPIAIQGEIIEVTTPTDPWIAAAIASTYWGGPGTRVTLYVSDAAANSGIGDGLVEGLSPRAITVDNAEWELTESSTGRYDLAADLQTAFTWAPFTEVEFRPGIVRDWDGAANAYLPAYPVVYVPPIGSLGADLTFDLGQQGYHSALAVVIDDSGAITWTNAPVDASEMEQTNANTDGIATIPALAFPTAGDYVIGLAASVRTTPNDLEELDPTRTAIRAGRMMFWRIHTE